MSSPNTLEDCLDGLRKGRRLICDRRDAPLLPALLKLVDDGLLTSNLVDVDDQSSYLEFRWAGKSS